MYTSLPILLLGKYYLNSMVVCKYVYVYMYVSVFVWFCRCVLFAAIEAVILHAFYHAVMCCGCCIGILKMIQKEKSLSCDPTSSRTIPYPPSTNTITQPHLQFRSFFCTPRSSLVYTSQIPILHLFSYLFSTSSLPLLYLQRSLRHGHPGLRYLSVSPAVYGRHQERVFQGLNIC